MLRGLCKLYSYSLSLSPPSRGTKEKAPGKTKFSIMQQQKKKKTRHQVDPLFTLFLFSHVLFSLRLGIRVREKIQFAGHYTSLMIYSLETCWFQPKENRGRLQDERHTCLNNVRKKKNVAESAPTKKKEEEEDEIRLKGRGGCRQPAAERCVVCSGVKREDEERRKKKLQLTELTLTFSPTKKKNRVLVNRSRARCLLI